MGRQAAHVFGSVAFGIGFVFIVVGRGELFTENFLVPVAGLDRRKGASWRNLAKLWLTSPLFNVLGGLVFILGFLLALGSFNHVIVVTLELIFGYRYGRTCTGRSSWATSASPPPGTWSAGSASSRSTASHRAPSVPGAALLLESS